jgi:pilus assembly protein CpaB
MNPRTLIVVVLAVVCGLSAMFLVQVLRKPQAGPVVEKTDVVFAAADVKPGESITDEMLEIRRMPVSEVPEDAIRKIADAVNRASMAQLDKGDMIRSKKLADKGAGRGMAALVRPGMRAFTIQTPSFSSSLAGFLLPGNRVDVLLTVESKGGPQDETGGGATTTLLQNVEILAVHTTVSTPTTNKINPDDARSVTLLVAPEEAELLDLGQNKGTLHLSLRNLKDGASTKPKSVSMTDLQLPRSRPKAAVAPTPPPAPLPPPPVIEEPDPEPIETKLTVRTLRGTAAGADVLTIIQQAPAGKSRVARGRTESPARADSPRAPQAPSGNQARPSAAPPRVAGPVG